MNRFQIYHRAVVILGYFSTQLGKLIFLFKKKKKIDFTTLEHLLINRSDKIGDAIISKPFIRLFLQYITKYKQFSGKVIILVSKLNKPILEDLPGEIDLVNPKIGIDTASIGVITWGKITQGFQCLCLSLTKKGGYNNTLLFDMIGRWDMSVLMYYFKQGYQTIASCNLSLGSSLLSHWISIPYTTFQGSRNLIETYIDMGCSLTGDGEQFRNYIYDNIDLFYNLSTDIESESKTDVSILLFIGCKPERNFSIQKRKEIIDSFETLGVRIDVIDDNSNLYYELLRKEKLGQNITLHKNTYSLGDFKQFASKFTYIVGLDGGGMNFVRNTTNNITIYTLADPFVWSQFTGRNTYKISNIGLEGRFLGDATALVGSRAIHNIYVSNKTFGKYRDFDPSLVVSYIKEHLL